MLSFWLECVDRSPFDVRAPVTRLIVEGLSLTNKRPVTLLAIGAQDR